MTRHRKNGQPVADQSAPPLTFLDISWHLRERASRMIYVYSRSQFIRPFTNALDFGGAVRFNWLTVCPVPADSCLTERDAIGTSSLQSMDETQCVINVFCSIIKLFCQANRIISSNNSTFLMSEGEYECEYPFSHRHYCGWLVCWCFLLSLSISALYTYQISPISDSVRLSLFFSLSPFLLQRRMQCMIVASWCHKDPLLATVCRLSSGYERDDNCVVFCAKQLQWLEQWW